MINSKTGLIALALMAAGATSAFAAGMSASSVGSSAAGGSSASVGLSSDSIGTSSDASSDSSKTDKVAEGRYKVVDVAAADDRPGRMRLKLQPMDTNAEAFELIVPVATVEQHRLAAGGEVQVQRRPYGLQFAHAADGKAFFLVVHDTWHRELASRPVTL